MATTGRPGAEKDTGLFSTWFQGPAKALEVYQQNLFAQQRAQLELAGAVVKGVGRLFADPSPPIGGGGKATAGPAPHPSANAPRYGSPAASTAPRPGLWDKTRQVAGQIGAQVSALDNGAGDAMTLGLGDPFTAGKLALEGAGPGPSLRDRYHALRQLQRAQDQYDATHYHAARTAGEVGGTALAILATDGMGAPAAGVRLAPQLPRAGAMAVRALAPYGLAAGTGAGASVAGQGVSDVLSGHLSRPDQYAAAAAGGGAGGLATLRAGPTAGAATEAAVTEATLAALQGRPVSLENIERNALTGAYLGRLGNTAGTEWSDRLKMGKKEHLGEWLAEQKTKLYGQKTVDKQINLPVKGGKTRVDQVTDAGKYVEVKFGRKARLSQRQKEAPEKYGADYQIDHFLPSDIGRAIGGILGVFGGQLTEDR